jgi:hypothetical protein
MAKKLLMIIGLCLCAGGMVFADENDDEIKPVPKNTAVIDVAPALGGLMMMAMYSSDGYDSAYAFGIGAHYERQIAEKMSLSARFAYGMMGFDDDYFLHMSSISAEAHYRYYPLQGTFFFDAMLGYANFSLEASGENKTTAHYFKYGGKLGWRIDFGRPGGFVLEPAIGYSGVAGSSNTKFFENDINGILSSVYNIIARGVFTGGIRYSLGLGYRF